MRHSNLRGQWIAASALMLLVLVLGMMACAAPSKPTVVINSPASGTQVTEGQDVTIQSTSTDAKGIVRVELSVDNVLARTETVSSPQKSFTVAQVWKATVGAHAISVRAYNADNVASDPAIISLSAVAAPTPLPTATMTATVAPTPGQPTAVPGPCVNNAAFVKDITVPDGTVLPAGQTFNKVWRMLNTGTCTWGPNYTFAFVEGDQMGAPNSVAAPITPPGAMVDIQVTMKASTAPGPHVGRWRLRGDDGVFFGALLDARINVPNPQPTPTCAGAPNISSFTASTTQVAPHTAVTLNWGLVGNANYAKIDPGIGPVATPGSIVVVVDGTTTYTLSAYCGNNVATAQVTINVVTPAPTPTRVPPTPKPAFRVTGASMNVSPSNYVGHCPGHFYYTGSITTNDEGMVTYRWAGSSGTSPSPILSFHAPGAGSHALPGYSMEWGAKGGQWAQLIILTPNQLSSNQASFTNSCADPTPIPPPPTATHVPPTATHPPPTATHVPPTPVPQRRNINGTWRAGDYSVELTEALGCAGAECGIAGRMIHQIGTTSPQIVDVRGQFHVYTGAVSFAAEIPGGQSFNGTVSADSRTMSGTLSGVGALTFTKQ